MDRHFAAAIVLASGSGERFGAGLPKQFLPLAGQSVVERSVAAFAGHPGVGEVVVVGHPAHRPRLEAMLGGVAAGKPLALVDGGATRQHSSSIGVAAVGATVEWVLIHDAARPLVSAELISACLEALARYAAVSIAVPSSDTVGQVGADGVLSAIPPRHSMWRMQTPQGFRLPVIREAQRRAEADGVRDASDDCSLVFRYRLADVRIVAGEERNIKITTPEDMLLAERLLRVYGPGESAGGGR